MHDLSKLMLGRYRIYWILKLENKFILLITVMI